MSWQLNYSRRAIRDMRAIPNGSAKTLTVACDRPTTILAGLISGNSPEVKTSGDCELGVSGRSSDSTTPEER